MTRSDSPTVSRRIAFARSPRSLALASCALLGALSPAQERPAPLEPPAAKEQAPAPPQDPAAVLEQLKLAMASREPAIAADAIARLGRTKDVEVVKLVAKALAHKEPIVRKAAIAALRFNEHEKAFDALLHAPRERLLADDDVAVDYYLALGQKGDPKALPILTQGLHIGRGSKVVKARVQAIGRIRTPQAVAELMQFLKSGKGGGRRGGGHNPHLADIVLSLAVLTGQTFGNDANAWIRWWADHDEGYKLPAESELGKKQGRQWQKLWEDGSSGRKGRKKDG
ncbi:MAG: hypothetical protein Fur0037_04330 [Planctomycetota bacterium]